jgi:hypothetical protein
LQQFRVVRQKLLDRLLDQNLNRYAAQHRGQLELPVFGLELGPGLGAAGGQADIRYSWAAASAWIRLRFLSGGHGLASFVRLQSIMQVSMCAVKFACYLASDLAPVVCEDAVQHLVNGDWTGRVTEGVLKRWAELVEQGHADYESLHSALNALCARYGKKPNSLARISVIKEGGQACQASAAAFSDELVTLLAAVFRGLTPAQKSEFRRQIA